MKTSSEENSLELLGQEVSKLLPDAISGQFRSSVAKVTGTRTEFNRAFVTILLGCVWVIALRGRRESEVAKAAMESAFATALKRLRALIDGNRLVPIAVQWHIVVAAFAAPVVIVICLRLLNFQARYIVYSKPAGDAAGFSIFHQPGQNPIYGVYSPGGTPQFAPAEQFPDWYIITPALPPSKKPAE